MMFFDGVGEEQIVFQPVLCRDIIPHGHHISVSNRLVKGKNMLVLNVFFNVKQQAEEEFVNLLRYMVVESNKESGCRLYQLYRNTADPLSYTLIEHWESQEHLDAHAKTEHWKRFDATVAEYLNSNYEVHLYQADSV